MKKKLMTILLAMLMLALSGCGALSGVKTSTIYVDKKDKVISATVASLNAEQYDEDELEQSIKEAIATYNGSEEKVKLNKLNVKKGQATLTMTYETSDDYEAFNSRVLFTGTVAEAKQAGYDFAGNFIDTSQAEVKGKTILDGASDEKVIITNEPVQIQTSLDIMYVSDNATIIDKRLAQVEAEVGATENGITFGNEAVAYIIYGEPKKN